MPGSDLASVIDAAVTEKLERVEAKRYGKTNKPRSNLEDADTSPGVRGIAVAVKRAVWKRDRGQCTFVTAEGKRCPERHRLEFHHDEPFALGGDRSADNIRLACRAHNAWTTVKPRWTNTASANLSLRTESLKLKPRPRAFEPGALSHPQPSLRLKS